MARVVRWHEDPHGGGRVVKLLFPSLLLGDPATWRKRTPIPRGMGNFAITRAGKWRIRVNDLSRGLGSLKVYVLGSLILRISQLYQTESLYIAECIVRIRGFVYWKFNARDKKVVRIQRWSDLLLLSYRCIYLGQELLELRLTK